MASPHTVTTHRVTTTLAAVLTAALTLIVLDPANASAHSAPCASGQTCAAGPTLALNPQPLPPGRLAATSKTRWHTPGHRHPVGE